MGPLSPPTHLNEVPAQVTLADAHDARHAPQRVSARLEDDVEDL